MGHCLHVVLVLELEELVEELSRHVNILFDMDVACGAVHHCSTMRHELRTIRRLCLETEFQSGDTDPVPTSFIA